MPPNSAVLCAVDDAAAMCRADRFFVPLAAFLRTIVASALLLVCAACSAYNRPAEMVAPSRAAATLASAPISAQGKSILVNIRSFELIALQDGLPAFRSRVIVGRPVTPTPELISSMYAIKFNPAWTPTPSMMRNEGAHYMPPGPHNPLGRILFELDNDQLIFLHDTNDRDLFNHQERALSHGCIRVEEARQLASWALDIPLAEVDQMVSRGATTSVPLPQPIQVSFIK